MSDSKHVYAAIASVQAKLAKVGVAKDRRNEQQNYRFRGIDDIYNALASELAEAGLCILPEVVSRDAIERQNSKGTALFYVTVCVRFHFVSAKDGSSHVVVTYGEAMDSGDKATNKAMSAAYKYACLQTFCIPTEGDNDADATTHEVQAKSPVGYESWLMDMEATASSGSEAMRQAWQESKAEFRDYLTQHQPEKLSALRQKAKAA